MSFMRKSVLTCRCGVAMIFHRTWENYCGGYEDIYYRCRSCKKTWWIEGEEDKSCKRVRSLTSKDGWKINITGCRDFPRRLPVMICMEIKEMKA